MKLDPEIVCPECSRKQEKRDKVKAERNSDATELRFVRAEGLTAAAAFLEDPKRDWPEDGRPVPSDYLNIAAYLSGIDMGDG